MSDWVGVLGTLGGAMLGFAGAMQAEKIRSKKETALESVRRDQAREDRRVEVELSAIEDIRLIITDITKAIGEYFEAAAKEPGLDEFSAFFRLNHQYPISHLWSRLGFSAARLRDSTLRLALQEHARYALQIASSTNFKDAVAANSSFIEGVIPLAERVAEREKTLLADT